MRDTWRLGVMVLGGLLAGCAGLTNLMPVPPQAVQVSSSPSDAIVSVNGVQQPETTPLTLTLDPGRSHDLRVEKPCYAPNPLTIQPSLRRRQLFLTVFDLVNQLPPTVHVVLTSTCAAGGKS